MTDSERSDFPVDQFETDLDNGMSELLDDLDCNGYEFNWPRTRRALERWIAAQEEGLDNAAQEQEHDR